MFAAIQFRLCLSLIPVMLSIPFAWKVHEKKMLNARQNMNNLSGEYYITSVGLSYLAWNKDMLRYCML